MFDIAPRGPQNLPAMRSGAVAIRSAGERNAHQRPPQRIFTLGRVASAQGFISSQGEPQFYSSRLLR